MALLFFPDFDTVPMRQSLAEEIEASLRRPVYELIMEDTIACDGLCVYSSRCGGYFTSVGVSYTCQEGPFSIDWQWSCQVFIDPGAGLWLQATQTRLI